MPPQSCLGRCCKRRRPDRALSGNIVAVKAESCPGLPPGGTQVLAAELRDGSHHFAKFQLEGNRGLSCGIMLDHQNHRVGLANQALPNHGGNQTHGNQYATSCFALPGSARPRILSRTQRLFHTHRRRRTPLRSTVSRLPAKFTNPIQTSPRCFRSCCRYRRCCHCRTAATAL